jgi:soluble lytic murein transglycosylase
VTTAVFLFALLALAVPGSPASHGYWIQAEPEGPAEIALHQAVRANIGAKADLAAAAYARVGDNFPATATSGLARLAAGLTLLEQARAADARPHLTHADVAKTALGDHAALAAAGSHDPADPAAAGEAYRVLLDAYPATPLACTALVRGADAFERARQPEKALPLLERALSTCAGQEPRVLLLTGRCLEQRRDLRGAAAAYDRVDRDFPMAPEAAEAAARLRTVAAHRLPETPEVRAARDLKKALTLFDAGRSSTAAPLLRRLLTERAIEDQRDLIRVRLGRALYEKKHWAEAQAQLRAVPAASPLAAEAAYYLARIDGRRRDRISGYEDVATRFAGTPWGEEALMAMANHYLKDALHEPALPFLRRIVREYPEGKHAERATWWVGLAEMRAGKPEEAGPRMEAAARKWTSTLTPGFLYWAGRARIEAGESRGRLLLEETVRRFKYTYHGLRALEALRRLPPSTVPPPPSMRAANPDPSAEVPPERLARIRQLLLIERLDEAAEELKLQPATSATQATVAWIHSRRGRLRPAITAMKRAYPEYVGEGGDLLPEDVLRIIYPLEYRSDLEARARAVALDPAIVAALICQESTFDAGALSVVGARGLMQIMPATGRQLARAFGDRFQRQALNKPEVSIAYGTRYLRQMTDQFGGHVERALAAYNAGPHRVDTWTATRPHVSAEDFIETIPFTETRGYVMIILANAERYRRIYWMGASVPAPVGG